jgi:hypothetical protein
MTDVNRLAPLMSSKVVGDTAEDAENFRATSTNFANLQVSSTTREFVAPEEDYEYCPNCSRKFFAGRLRLHLKSCKDGKPLKPLKSKPINEQIVREETALNKTADDVMSYRIPSHQKVDQNASFGASYRENAQETSPQLGSIKTTRQEEVYSKQALSTRSPQKEQPNEEDWNGNEPAEDEARNRQPRGVFIDDGIEREKAEDGRLGCVTCGRFFMAERIQQHEKACKKSQKKRAVFDATKQRAVPDQDGMIPKPVEKSKAKKLVTPVKAAVNGEKIDVGSVPPTQQKEEKSAKKAPAWKTEHENFIKNIRFNRELKEMEARGEDTSNLVAPTIVNENYVPCPHCTRKFAPATAERHIPKCKNTFNRPKPPKSLQLEKLEDGQKGDRTKTKFMIKKGPNLRMSPSHAGSTGATGENPKSPMTPTPGRNGNHRSPGSNFSTANYETQVDEAMGSKASPKENAKRSNQFGPLRADSKLGMKKLGSFDSKQAIGLDQKTYETSDLSPNGHEIKLPEKRTRDYRSQSPSAAGARDGKKVFTEAMPKKEELLQNYQNIFDRSASYQTDQCPHCSRKFSHHAAERHIPVCKTTKARPLRREEQEALAADKTRNKMYLTGLGTKANFKVNRGEGKEEEGHPKTSQNGASSTEYEHFFARVQSKNGDKPPLPFKKPLYGGVDSNGVIPERLSSLQKAKLGSAGASASHFCTSCGLKMMKSHRFCGSCGIKK